MRRALALVAAIGAMAALLDECRTGFSPSRRAEARPTSGDLQRLAVAVAHEEDHVTAEELARWQRTRTVRLVDVRTAAEFAKGHLTGAQNVPIESIASAAFNPSDTIVLLSEGGAHAAQAWVFLQLRGYRNVYFLRPAADRPYTPGKDGC